MNIFYCIECEKESEENMRIVWKSLEQKKISIAFSFSFITNFTVCIYECVGKMGMYRNEKLKPFISK